jgi:hypothetical protein
MGAIDRRKRVARDRRRGYAERGYCPRCLPFQFFDHTGLLNQVRDFNSLARKQLCYRYIISHRVNHCKGARD